MLYSPLENAKTDFDAKLKRFINTLKGTVSPNRGASARSWLQGSSGPDRLHNMLAVHMKLG